MTGNEACTTCLVGMDRPVCPEFCESEYMANSDRLESSVLECLGGPWVKVQEVSKLESKEGDSDCRLIVGVCRFVYMPQASNPA